MAKKSCKTLGAQLDRMNKVLDTLENRIGSSKERKSDRQVFGKKFIASMAVFRKLEACKPKK